MWDEETKAPRAYWTWEPKKKNRDGTGTGTGVPNPLGPFFLMVFPLCAEVSSEVREKMDLVSAAGLARFIRRVLDQFPACWILAA